MKGELKKMSTQDDVFRIAGASLRAIREAKGLSQEDLSFDANIDQSTLSKVERLGPHVMSWGKIVKIAAALDCLVEISFKPRS